ncbi:hypothetical protein DFH05DRAFT_767883 [Lentinula detonsa]|uniref:Ankyrin n=2 Tax=Lentinula detonsa TaxID=2804962 RepID=A0A9W8TZQ1_9AGAR|nr:hypothetical protein DFH05DRAFT_767883 [Lentinula detonsa]
MKDALKRQRFSCLELLPVELLHEIQLYALSHHLPCTSGSLHQIFKFAPPSFKAEYIYLRLCGTTDGFYSKALRYPLCSLEVLRFIKQYTKKTEINIIVIKTPKHLFQGLAPRKYGSMWTDQDHPLPFIRGLYSEGFSLDIHSMNDYPLIKAVHTGFEALVQFLLEKGASPAYKDNLAVRVAIRRKDLRLVKLLVERSESGEKKTKKRKLEDRVTITKDLLKLAVKCNTQEIVDYFTQEKGCVPDMQTLYLMH